MLPLVDAIQPIWCRRGKPRRKPESLYADRAYHCATRTLALALRGIRAFIAERGEPHGSGLGKVRWVIERSLSWLHQFRRLRVRYERRADIHEGFMMLGCIFICYRQLPESFC
jgi:transposase